MFLEGRVGSTIVSMLSALAYVHKLAGYKNPCDTYAIKKLIISIQKETPSVDLRCPINSLILNKRVTALPSVCQLYDAIKFKALFLALFYGCFRVGERIPGGEGSVGCLLRPDRGPAYSQGVSSGPNLSIPLSVNNSPWPDQ